MNRFQNVLIRVVSVIDHFWIDYGQYAGNFQSPSNREKYRERIFGVKQEVKLCWHMIVNKYSCPLSPLTKRFWNIQFFMYNRLILKFCLISKFIVNPLQPSMIREVWFKLCGFFLFLKSHWAFELLMENHITKFSHLTFFLASCFSWKFYQVESKCSSLWNVNLCGFSTYG